MATNVIIVGAGPYGLSLAAMLRAQGVEHRIFGRPMQTWRSTMPHGMSLKSEGFASDLYGPGEGFSLRAFCAEQGIAYQDTGLPVSLELFSAYGEAFQRMLVPHLEERDVARVAPERGGFTVELEDGEICHAQKIVMAVGITHYAHSPEAIAGLPEEVSGHASRFHKPAIFAGRDVAVVGAGASATDYAALLAQAGANVTLIARAEKISFLGPPLGRKRTLMEEIRAPQSGLGPGWKSRIATDAPVVFHYMPERFRILVAKRHLGPAGGWWTREAIETKAKVLTGTSVTGAKTVGARVRLQLADSTGSSSVLDVDQVVAATGYKPELRRLGFLAPELQALPAVAGVAKLSSHFESAYPGLYFTGLSSVYEFGPTVRFAFGASFTARRLSRHIAARHRRSAVTVRGSTAPAMAGAAADPA